jgi:bacteriocin-like protein
MKAKKNERKLEHKPARADSKKELNDQQLATVVGGEALHTGTHIPKVIIELTRPTSKTPQ